MSDGEDEEFVEARVIGDWEEHWEEDANAYYYVNTETEETTWEAPPEFQTGEGSDEDTGGDDDGGDGPPDSLDGDDEEEGGGEWEEHYDDEREEHYYFHTGTQQTVWDKPEDFVEPVALAPLPANWIEIDDDDGQIYYFNEVSGETSWDRPEPEVEAVEEEDDDEGEEGGDEGGEEEKTDGSDGDGDEKQTKKLSAATERYVAGSPVQGGGEEGEGKKGLDKTLRR